MIGRPLIPLGFTRAKVVLVEDVRDLLWKIPSGKTMQSFEEFWSWIP